MVGGGIDMSASNEEARDRAMKTFTVAKPVLTTLPSFTEGAMDSDTQARMRSARRDWSVTDGMRVRSYSCSVDKLRLDFGSVTLEIVADGPTVNWRVSELLPPLAEKCDGSCLLLHADDGLRREIFDKNAVLEPLI